MTRKIFATVLLLAIGTAGALAQPAANPPPPSDAVDGEPGADTNAQPSLPPPAENVPAPPPRPPAPPPQDKQPAVTGQWMYTTQYGWVWIPYDARYTFEPDSAAAYPYQYAYRVNLGWRWLAAPWVWGWGPHPYFGYWGPWHFHWYRGPWPGHGRVLPPHHPGHPGFPHPGFPRGKRH